MSQIEQPTLYLHTFIPRIPLLPFYPLPFPQMPHYTIIDIETTGGDPKVDRITEIAIYLHDGEKVIDTFVSLVNPEMPIPAFITGITGIDNEMVRSAPKFYEIAKRIVEITEGAIFVAHNVRFDYSFVQKEFRNLGYTFSRKQLCTVKLSRKLIPGHKSYSLSKLAPALGIKNEASHRAFGDATATVELFEMLLAIQSGTSISLSLQQEIAQVKLPPHLDPVKLDQLSEETGVYFFHGKQGDIIYVGKSTNIRKRILSHFQGAHKSNRTMEMINSIHDISTEETGSELIALLRENEEIKRIQPLYNRAQLRQNFRYGIYQKVEESGYIRLYLDKYRLKNEPVAGYSSKGSAESALQRRGREFELCPKLYGAEQGSGRCFHHQLHICRGACVEEEEATSYNERVGEAIQALGFGRTYTESYAVVGAGRQSEEKSVVWVQDGVFRGYAYLDEYVLELGWEEILSHISSRNEVPDVQRIIKGYIKKHPREVHPVTI